MFVNAITTDKTLIYKNDLSLYTLNKPLPIIKFTPFILSYKSIKIIFLSVTNEINEWIKNEKRNIS